VLALIASVLKVSFLEDIHCESFAALLKHLPAAQLLPLPDIERIISQLLDEPGDYISDCDGSQLDGLLTPLASLPAAQQISEQTAKVFLRQGLKKACPSTSS
jgi:hypothetical protein